MYVGLEVGQRWTSNAELMNLDTAITAMSALMIVMLVPSGRYLGLISYLLTGCGYGLGAVSVWVGAIIPWSFIWRARCSY